MDRPTCRHCGAVVVRFHRKSLCRGCYDRPGVRGRYPSLHPQGQYDPAPDFHRSAALPTGPTFTAPGTQARIEVLAERRRLRQRLNHPLDTKLDYGGHDAAEIDGASDDELKDELQCELELGPATQPLRSRARPRLNYA